MKLSIDGISLKVTLWSDIFWWNEYLLTILFFQKIQDPDPFIQCDLMDGRDAFLTLAREKHYEFSSLRRAKYSTMSMLYELHNQSQDKFVYTCNNCRVRISLHGMISIFIYLFFVYCFIISYIIFLGTCWNPLSLQSMWWFWSLPAMLWKGWSSSPDG